jgi:Uma2 family endonuclease
MITDINELDLNKRYTYADYLNWQFDDMVELIRGKVFSMSPAPNTSHQRISGHLFRLIANHLHKKPCQVFSAPFDVRLPLPPEQQTADRIDTVVQPDISVIGDPAKIDERGCQGPPDWIVEILTKSTAEKDLKDKFELYQFAGVREYWIVSQDQTVLPYRRNENGIFTLLRQQPFVKHEVLTVSVLPGFQVMLEEVFEE